MIRKSRFYSKMIFKILKKEVVNQDDYRASYNEVASTYQDWIAQMGRFTDRIIKPAILLNKTTSRVPVRVLDFACGTGYISRKVIEMDLPCEITAVDISERMLEHCADLSDKGVKLVNMEGGAFLNETKETFDVILCGWALPYFQHKVLLKQFREKLSEGGVVGVIANSKGTLHKMEEIFLRVMAENPGNVRKPMNIALQLPKGTEGLECWFRYHGFVPVEIDEGEVTFSFDTPEDLLAWLNQTGALAGTMQIFDNYEKVKRDILREIKKEKYRERHYEINHKYVYGIFRNGGVNGEHA
ncbi:class I SAM-dependent methyltransferase [Anoxynatronum buryatiense]|uniref:Methyltransferase domain-containing protein n=1 Tax=Anoxynatronum buryatiense TaxID=489973 RepID=A0AA45WZ45_9CLOT|nr:class I SAM-dependent methyltransferase [Anoxynatronum buryatiense]SMP72161.1 Methyltransferase domain-containing protein [Anoxynatronum buryatiense]